MWKTLPVGAMAHLALYVVFCAKVPPRTPSCRAGKVLVGEIKAKIANFGVNSFRPKRPLPTGYAAATTAGTPARPDSPPAGRRAASPGGAQSRTSPTAEIGRAHV